MDKGHLGQRVLIVDIRCLWTKQVSRHLFSADFTCRIEPKIETATEVLTESRYDILIVSEDATRRKIVDFCKDIRNEDSRLTIIAVLNGDKPVVESKLFDAGLDDVVHGRGHSKTFIKRVFTRVRLRQALHIDNELCQVGESLIDCKSRQVWNRGKLCSISRTQLGLLNFFIRNRDRIISREEVCEILWADSVVDPEGKNLDMQVVKLRRLIEKDPKRPKIIRTVRGAGYKLSLNP